jgi:prepilin-type N-terminal cleavage/methylation domain-containing protein
MNHLISKNNRARGFTLVEILVVLVIAAVVISIAIPRIRTVNKERNTREAARVIGSAFANASQRASIDGVAGVRITRNPNFDQGGFQFAASEISLLRKVPNFAGDQEDAQITGSNEAMSTVDIDAPLEQASLNIVKAGDSISFSNSSLRYRITNVTGTGTLTLTLARGLGNYMPIPTYDATPGATNPSYVIHRLPRILRSSKTELPDGYIVDLRFSGFEVLDQLATSQLTEVFQPILQGPITVEGPGGVPVTFPHPVTNNFSIDFIFDEEGAIDRVMYVDTVTDPTNIQTIAMRTPLGPLYFFVTEAPESTEMSEQVASQDETSLWVTVSNLSGSTNVGYNNSAPTAGQDYQTMTTLYDTDRDAFNDMMGASRDNTLSSSANQ